MSVNDKFPPDDGEDPVTGNSEEARKRRRDQIVARLTGQTETAKVEADATPIGLPMADVESWQIAEAIRGCGGMLKHAAAKLHVHRNTLYRRLRREPELRDIVVEEREIFIDEAESVLMKKLKEENLDAAKFVLTQLGAKRGYRAPGGNGTFGSVEEDEALDQRTQPVDLKRLTNEELETLETLLRKAAVEPDVIEGEGREIDG